MRTWVDPEEQAYLTALVDLMESEEIIRDCGGQIGSADTDDAWMRQWKRDLTRNRAIRDAYEKKHPELI